MQATSFIITLKMGVEKQILAFSSLQSKDQSCCRQFRRRYRPEYNQNTGPFAFINGVLVYFRIFFVSVIYMYIYLLGYFKGFKMQKYSQSENWMSIKTRFLSNSILIKCKNLKRICCFSTFCLRPRKLGWQDDIYFVPIAMFSNTTFNGLFAG